MDCFKSITMFENNIIAVTYEGFIWRIFIGNDGLPLMEKLTPHQRTTTYHSSVKFLMNETNK